MTRPQPAEAEVKTVMERVLAEAAEAGRHPKLTAVERELGITHATFYRNYPDLIDWFKQATNAQRPENDARRKPRGENDEALARLRRENEDLRRTVRIYAEQIRQLTVDNEALTAQLNARAGVVDLDSRRSE